MTILLSNEEVYRRLDAALREAYMATGTLDELEAMLRIIGRREEWHIFTPVEFAELVNQRIYELVREHFRADPV